MTASIILVHFLCWCKYLFLHLHSLTLMKLNKAPSKPPITPSIITGKSSYSQYSSWASSMLKMMNPPDPKNPQPSLHTSMSSLMVTLTMAVVKKVRQVSCGLQKEATSSIANRTPPTGARKAAATPAHAPHVMRSRRSLSFLNSRSQRVLSLNLVDPPCERKAAIQAPVCTSGPSLPTAKPPATLPMLPTTLPIRVRKSSTPGRSTPLR
mmetsp:Transcript_14767/g.37559  ORF Transcript_14767/g.37559 Transcript_14767/m.37559 type:complete len:209 (-) Transcript_14767:658-1284(-)